MVQSQKTTTKPRQRDLKIFLEFRPFPVCFPKFKENENEKLYKRNITVRKYIGILGGHT